jgi:hypothetical protein
MRAVIAAVVRAVVVQAVVVQAVVGAVVLGSAVAPARAADAPYQGVWDCSGYGVLTITGDTYDFGERSKIAEVTRDGPAYILTMTDGYTVAVAVEGRTLNWFSPESGDSFDCTRTK